MRRLWTLALGAAVLGCAKGAEVGEPCTITDPETQSDPIAVQTDNPDCASDTCLQFGENSYCTEECESRDDCGDDYFCLPMTPFAEGAYCFRYKVETDLDPGTPVEGSALYHASDALAEAQSSWASDAYLAEVMSSGTMDVDGLMGTEGSWRYTFLAPSKPDMQADVTVDVTGVEAATEWNWNEDIGPQATDLLSGSLWRFDSIDLIRLGSEYGADTFVSEHPQHTVSYRVSGGVLESEEAAIWNFGITDTEDFDGWTEMFDAGTGAKLF